MYEEQNKAAEAQLKAPESVLVSKLNENGEQVEKLYTLVEQLASRLTGVRSNVPTASTTSEAAKENMYSPTVSQLVRQTDSIKGIQAYIVNLMNELEV